MLSVNKPVIGDWYHVEWLDICSDESGDPKDAKLVRRINVLRFKRTEFICGKEFLVLTLIQEEPTDEDESQEGWWAIPSSVILNMFPVSVDRTKPVVTSGLSGPTIT